MRNLVIFILFAFFAISVKAQNEEQILNPDEAIIEFSRIGSTMYVAKVLRSSMKVPIQIQLCEQKQIEEILEITTNNTKIQTESLYLRDGEKLYELIWKPLEKELSNVKTVYYTTAGLLHKIAFNAIPTEKEDVLLSDKYNLHLLSNISELAHLKKEKETLIQDTVVIYGGLTYDLQQLNRLKTEKRYNEQDEEVDFLNDRRQHRAIELSNTELDSSFAAWNYIAGTKTETEQIVSLLESQHIPYRYYTEDKGTEESFKQLSGTKTGVIHIATQSFFLPYVENKTVENLIQRLGGDKENLMLHSALIMSGANRQWTAPENVTENDKEDGILTADEISRLDLQKTKLAVLSACETGLGIITDEGIFGLQRAFKLAGVESLIMSLWKVPDDATAELMTSFYQEWLSGKTKQNAFKTAQQKVREKYKSPYYWAAFVMMD